MMPKIARSKLRPHQGIDAIAYDKFSDIYECATTKCHATRQLTTATNIHLTTLLEIDNCLTMI